MKNGTLAPGIALGGSLLLLLVTLGMTIASLPSRYSEPEEGISHPSMLDVELPESVAELMWLLQVSPRELPAKGRRASAIRARLQANLAWDAWFPAAYFAFFTGALFLLVRSAPLPKPAAAAAVVAGGVMLATVLLDYRENAGLKAILDATAEQSSVQWERLVAPMKTASLSKWALLGAALGLFAVTQVLAARGREPAAVESFRVFAAAAGGALGLWGAYRASRGMIQGEVILFSLVAVSVLWESGVFFWNRKSGAGTAPPAGKAAEAAAGETPGAA